MNLILDGKTYTKIFVRTPITRQAVVADTQNSGSTVSGIYKRDLVGTFYNYSFILDMTNIGTDEYDALYEILTKPVASHILQVPYGQTMMALTVYITEVTDTLVKDTDRKYWRALTFQALGQKPERIPE